MEKLVLEATKREVFGKKAAQERAAGKLPAVAYGHGHDPEALMLDSRAAEKIYAQAGGNKIISLKVADQTRNVVIHDVQHDPRTGSLIHADLYIVRMDEKLRTEVPLHFVGESVAVYQQDGTLIKNLEALEIEALPADLPESIEVDISVLDDFDKTIAVSDLVIPQGVELLTDPEELVAKVEAPRTDEELAELDEAVSEELPEGVAEEAPSVVSEENEGDKDRRDKK